MCSLLFYPRCNLFNLLVVRYKRIVCPRMCIFCAHGNEKKAAAATKQRAAWKKLTMWNIEFPMAKINEFPHHKVRTMHEIKMGIEFDAGVGKNVMHIECVCVWWFEIDHTIVFNWSGDCGDDDDGGGKWHTIYALGTHSKNHTLSIYSHVFLPAHSNLFVESGITICNLENLEGKKVDRMMRHTVAPEKSICWYEFELRICYLYTQIHASHSFKLCQFIIFTWVGRRCHELKYHF